MPGISTLETQRLELKHAVLSHFKVTSIPFRIQHHFEIFIATQHLEVPPIVDHDGFVEHNVASNLNTETGNVSSEQPFQPIKS